MAPFVGVTANCTTTHVWVDDEEYVATLNHMYK